MLYRKILKILSIFILLLLGLFAIIILTINLPGSRKFIVKIINRNLQKSEVPVHIGALNTIGFGQLSLSNILITGEQNDTIISAGTLEVHFAPRTLINRKITLGSFTVHDLKLRLLQTDPAQPLNLIKAFSNGTNSSQEQQADTSKSWTFDIRNIRLTSLDFSYHSQPQKMLANLILKEAAVRINKMNLTEKEMIISLIHLDNVNGELYSGDKPPEDSNKTSFEFPWNIEIANFSIQNSSLKSGKYPETNGAIVLPLSVVSGFNTEMSDINLKQDQQGIKILQAGFHLNNGFKLRDFHGEVESRNEKTAFEFHVFTNESEIHLNGNADTSLFDIGQNNVESMLSISDTRIDLSDLTYFKPEIINAGWYNEYGKNPVSIDAGIFRSGNIIRFDSLYMYVSNDLWLTLVGGISDLTVKALSKDVNLIMMSSLGNITLDGNIDIAKERVNAFLIFNEFRPGDIIEQNVLQEINGSVMADINGFNRNRLYSDFKMLLHSVNINNHVYDTIALSGNISPKRINLLTDVNDTALTLGLQTSVMLNKNELSVNTRGDFRVVPSELEAGKIDLTVDGLISGNFHKTGDRLSAALDLSDIDLTKKDGQTGVNRLQFKLDSDSSKTLFSGNSDFMNLNFEMEDPVKNAGIFFKDLSDYFSALASSFFLDSAFHKFDIPAAKLDARFRYHPIINMIANDTSLKFTDALIYVSSAEQTGKFYGDVLATGIHTGSLKIRKFHAELSDSAGNIQLATNADSISIGSQFFSGFNLAHQYVYGSRQGHTILLATKEDGRVISEIEFISNLVDSFLIVSLPSQQILLNETLWQTSSAELFRYNPHKGEFLPEITLFTDSTELKLVTIKENPETGFNILFDNVNLSSLVPAGLLPGGTAANINGSVRYRTSEPENSSINADIDLAEVKWSDMSIAHIGIDGSFNSTGNNIYRIASDVSMDSAGIYLEVSSISAKDRVMEVQFSELPLNLAKPFLKDELSELSGNVFGNIRLVTDDDKQILKGDINLNNVRVRVSALNSLFRIPENKIILAGNKILFDRFIILDSLNNELFVDGNIDFTNTAAIKANLDISSPQMLAMNSTQDDNSTFFGTVLVGTELSVRGPLKAPRLQGNLSLNNGTEIFYVNQTSYKLHDMTETVTFINTGADEDSAGAETEKQVDEQPFTIGATVEVDPKTILHFSLEDQLYNINLDIQGGGTLNYSVFSNKQSNLSGLYEISNGNADFKFKGWSEKKFDITDGSFIRWIDRMEDPQLEIEALSEVTGKYRNPADRRERIVEFNVVLKLINRLSELDVLFTVKTEDPYLMSIINAMSPEEQMKQAVSLLLFQTINIPGIYTTSNQITDQVNQIVENQLNKLTQTSIKNIDISLGVNSYTAPTESGAEETQTSLSYDIKKNIFNDRASVEVSGRLNNNNQQEDNYTARNFRFEYRLDSAATKYFQVYSQRSYEDILEGEVEKTGFGIILRKNLESIRNIWPGNRKRKTE